jgi:hypothetical protein
MTTDHGPRVVVETASSSLRNPGAGPLTAVHVTMFYGLARLGRLDEAILRLSPAPASGANRGWPGEVNPPLGGTPGHVVV